MLPALSRFTVTLLFLALMLLAVCVPPMARAQVESPAGLRVCSQNLFRFGEKPVKARAGSDRWEEKTAKQKEYLVERMKEAGCDVIAVQEVIGASKREAERTLSELADAWQEAIGDKVDYFAGDSLDEHIRCGYLVRHGAGHVVAVKNFLDEPLPRLQPLGPAGRFLRAPVALLFDARQKTGTRRFWILNIHLKSRARGFEDPSGTDFELLRMEMAEAVKNIVRRELNSQPPGTVFIVTGDRNGDLVMAASQILSGRRTLDDFKHGGSCKLTPDDHPECSSPEHEAQLVGLFEKRRELFPDDYRGGTYLYHGGQELLDEIYVLPQAVASVRRPDGKLRIGFEGQFYKGSDHKMVWADFQN